MDPVHILDARMMPEEIDKAYTDSGFLDVLKIVGYISFLAVVLACLGMLGMAMYATQTRMKEVGVRKVMGAASWDVVYLLSKGFLLLILIGGCIGTPVGYLLGTAFLDNYAYKAPLSIVILFSGFLIMTLLGVLTIGSQTLSAARRNPVDTLRYE
jgi:ABC-type antimicrobial peptide transport system permease subunit